MPGGKKEKGETPEETLLRELEEEISVRPKKYSLISKTPFLPKYYYFVELCKEEASKVKLGDEGQKLEFFTLEEAEKLELSTGIKYLLSKYRKFLSS